MLVKIVLTFAVLAGVALFVAAGFSIGHSASFNYPWAAQYINSFGWDAWIPRHLPSLWSGLGGYDFFFYAPVPFWFIASVVSPLCFECGVETKIVLGAALFWILGGLNFYIFLRRYLHGRFAVLGAIVYAVLPYHLLLDWFVRQAIGEFSAYAFIPLIAYGFDEIRLNGRHAWTLSIGFAGAALCHLPTALLAVHVFGVVACLIAWQKYRERQDARGFLVAVVAWCFLGGFFSCFYWLPALILLESVSSHLLYTDYYIAQLWLFGFSFDQPSPGFAKTILWSFLALLPFICTAVFFSEGNIRMWILVPAITVVLLNIDATGFVWRNWIIQKVQFPWRMMVFADFSAAIAVALLFRKFNPFYTAKMVLICFLLAALPVAKVGQATVRFVTTEYETQNAQLGAAEYLSLEMGNAISKQLSSVNDGRFVDRVVISKRMQEVFAELAENNAYLMSFKVSHRRATAIPLQDVEQLSLPLQYWSLWQAEIEGDIPLVLSANQDNGTIDVIAPADGFQGRTISLKLPYHWSEKVGFAVSLLSIVLALFIMFRAILRTPYSSNEHI